MSKIIAMSFREGRPFSAVTEDGDTYDIEYSSVDEVLYYHVSGYRGVDNDNIFVESGDNYWLAKGYGLNNQIEAKPEEMFTDDDIKDYPPNDIDSWANESEVVYCGVCDTYITEDDAYYHHRHLCMNPDSGEWLGTGSEYAGAEDVYKESFNLIFSKIEGFAEALKNTIINHKMGFNSIHFGGSILGTDSIDCYLFGVDDKSISYGNDLLGLIEDDENNETENLLSYAIWWMIGLDNEKTEEENQLTIKWIDEYLKSKEKDNE